MQSSGKVYKNMAQFRVLNNYKYIGFRQEIIQTLPCNAINIYKFFFYHISHFLPYFIFFLPYFTVLTCLLHHSELTRVIKKIIWSDMFVKVRPMCHINKIAPGTSTMLYQLSSVIHWFTDRKSNKTYLFGGLSKYPY